MVVKPPQSPGAKALVRGIVFSTAAVAAGDTICQWIEDPSKWDRARTLRMATATACVMAPTSWLIVMRLEKLFPGNAPRAVLAKTVANGLCAAPMISLNFAAITLLEGNEDPTAVFQNRVGSKLLPTMLNGILYWPFVNAMNFKYVALENRPIVGSCAGVLWNVYMSSVINAKAHHHHDEEQLLAVEAAAAAAETAKEEEKEEGGWVVLPDPKAAAAAAAAAAAEESVVVGAREGEAAWWERWVPAGAVATFPGSINIRFF